MFSINYIKNDFRQIFKSPIMILFFTLPLILSAIFKTIAVFLLPWLQTIIPFDPAPYYSYALAAVMTFAPISLGIVTGFIMLDEKDGRIYELMSITPLGEMGYIVNRMVFTMSASFLFTLASYFILNIYSVPFLTLFILAVLMSLIAPIIALCLFFLATDKVKGLTYAKGLNLFSLFTLADLLHIEWLSLASHAVPTYWVTKIVQNPSNFSYIVLGFIVCGAWLGAVFWVWKKKEK